LGVDAGGREGEEEGCGEGEGDEAESDSAEFGGGECHGQMLGVCGVGCQAGGCGCRRLRARL